MHPRLGGCPSDSRPAAWEKHRTSQMETPSTAEAGLLRAVQVEDEGGLRCCHSQEDPRGGGDGGARVTSVNAAALARWMCMLIQSCCVNPEPF